jgi:hypothetical protein
VSQNATPVSHDATRLTRYDPPVRRPYLFEVVAIANLLVVMLVAYPTIGIAGSPWGHWLTFSASMLVNALGGIAVRACIALVRRDRTYFATIRTRAWIIDTVRLVVAAGAVVVGYGWLKLVVPIYHPRLFDQLLWELDRTLFVGVAPTTFFVEVFSGAPWFLRLIDWSYANIFFATAVLAFSFFLSHPQRRIRVAFANGNALLWIAGVWLYLLVPSVGPAFRFPEVWFAHAEVLRTTQAMQALLMRNYQNVLRAAGGMPVSEPIRIVFGVAAFPSMHVAFQAYVFLWMRRLWRSGQIVVGVFLFAIFLGSMITGWHYLVDSLAGLGMAFLAFRICFPRHGINDTRTGDAGGDPGGTNGAGSAGIDRNTAE